MSLADVSVAWVSRGLYLQCLVSLSATIACQHLQTVSSTTVIDVIEQYLQTVSNTTVIYVIELIRSKKY